MLRPSFLLPASALEGTSHLASRVGKLCAAHPLVSAAASGAGRQWRPFSADGRGNVDRFAAERHWRSLTPSHAQTMVESVPSLAWEGEIDI